MNSSEQKVLDIIKTTPYFSVRIEPIADTKDLEIVQLKNLLLENKVSLRGWDFPHYDEANHIIDNNHLGLALSWLGHVELWRFYESRQFVYLSSLWDVFSDSQDRLRHQYSSMFTDASPKARSSVVGLISFIGLIYTVTEFHLFAARLSSSEGFGSAARLTIKLRNVENWALIPGEPGVIWYSHAQSKISDIEIPIPDPKHLMQDPLSTSASALKYLFRRFDWDPSADLISDRQRQFIGSRSIL